MEHSDRPAVVVARVVITHLQQGVQAWADADRILTADGSSLLAMLDRAVEGLDGEDTGATRAGIEAFIGSAQALVEGGVLDAGDSRPQIEVAAALGALLRSADGTVRETRRQRGDREKTSR